MKPTFKEKIARILQVTFVNVMYWKYWTYLCVYYSIYLYITLYLLVRFLLSLEGTPRVFVDRLAHYYRDISSNTTPTAYIKNKIRLKYEILKKRKDL